MTNEEAKFILNAYRPDGRDADDPAMAEALQQAKVDPTLAAWFGREQAYGAAVSGKLAQIAPPVGLREAILAGARLSETQPADSRRRTWWRRPVWLAVAAGFALLLAWGAWWGIAPVRGGTIEEFAVNFVDRGFRLEKHSADLAVLKSWLGEHRGPLPEALPAKFAELRALGCRTLDFRGREVSLVCFEHEGKEFHVFVTKLDDRIAPVGGADGMFRFIDRGRLAAATWSDAKNRYVVVSDAGLDAVKRVL